MFKDARDAQIAFLGMFLVLGISTRDWTIQPGLMAAIAASCLLTQWLAQVVIPKLQGQVIKLWQLPPSWKSALITALGLCLLLRGNHYWSMALAGVVAIASKFLLRVGNKHFFNPANFGIIVALTLTPDAWVSPGQWGTQAWYLLLFLGAGGLVLKWVGRWETSAAFLCTYAGLEAVRYAWLGWTADVYLHKLMSGSLLLFALFMVTDPRSIPNARQARVVWAVLVAWLTFLLQEEFFLTTGMFWALFVLAPLTPVLDRIWSAPQFQFTASKESTPLTT
ncbi:MAG: Na+-transporting NADH:ubiquinone oxidoreductase, subunit NqrB [Spirulina sp. SIO3F2]|nr:Na+-transporting NADH:ubiquinone oxidoreductase, subunit NqrB [Spirulina sp. SIO3F2]